MSSRPSEIPSFSLAALAEAVTFFGGENTSNALGAHLAGLYRETTFAEVVAKIPPSSEVWDTAHAIGGDLGRALSEVRRSLREPLPARGNATAQWLAVHGKSTRTMLIEHLSHKLPTSRCISVVEDHVQTFFCRLVEKDTLATWIASGKTVLPSVLRVWAFQSAVTEIRGWGVDASLRKSRGAKTNRDRMADAGNLPLVVIHSPDAVIERRYLVENSGEVVDLHDPNAVSVEDSLIADETMARAKALIAGVGPQYAALVESLFDGKKRADLSAEFPRNKMASMLARIREVLSENGTLSD